MKTPEHQLPETWAWTVSGLCLLPGLVIALTSGLDALRPGGARDIASLVSAVRPASEGPGALDAFALATILEWSVLFAAVFTSILAVVHFVVKREVAALVMGLTLVAAASLDAFHSIIAMSLALPETGSSPQLARAFCRSFGIIVMILGGTMIRGQRPGDAEHPLAVFLSTAGILGALVYGVQCFAVTIMASPGSTSQTLQLTRVWNLIPMFLIFYAYAFVYRPAYTRHPNLFFHSLLMGIIAQVAAQVHLSLGLYSVHSPHYLAARFLELVSFVLPFLGLSFDFVRDCEESSRARGDELELRSEGLHRELLEKRWQMDEARRELAEEVTARREVEEQLKRSVTFFRDCPLPAVELAPDAHPLTYNRAGLNLVYGIGKGSSCRLLPEDVAHLVSECLRTLHPKDGARAQVGSHDLRWSFFPDPAGQFVYGVCWTGEQRVAE